jgi:hypothetical protein
LIQDQNAGAKCCSTVAQNNEIGPVSRILTHWTLTDRWLHEHESTIMVEYQSEILHLLGQLALIWNISNPRTKTHGSRHENTD